MRRRAVGRGRRSLTAVAVALLIALACASCQASAHVSVAVRPDGSGTVTVTVTLDPAANTAVGGLASQLDTAGLAAQGWAVGPVTATAGGGASVAAAHRFATPAQLSEVVASIAGSGGTHVVELALRRTHSLWQDRSTLTGRIDLSCGVGCFGDQGLTGPTGSPLGFDPAEAAAQAGVQPAQALSLRVGVALPGALRSTDATSRSGGQLEWSAPLGDRLALDATTRTWNTGAITAAAVAAGVLLVVLVGLGWLLWRRRRRPRGAHSRRPRAPAGSRGG
ncbi:LPXTG cell wall anchor domain-containing protein [Acidiferrimicrobium sp. IK]|uniref:LppM family (lipo)protein n=1 Tax=Acidiferrimicrobium sp. IK TaxID=2871700 RepID=UPI0021CB0208|nr:LPXTG cell wall anchor domain-containing protein [Acidiferrimicrobium sp. IK]MCU4186972.1 LPXTG cell wall anchor domain-containing protein [Acidiferrimicrobium sp. IK]